MSLDLSCRECQAGLTQVLQSALGFTCIDHGMIGIEVTELMKIATSPLEARIKELNRQLYETQSSIEAAREEERVSCAEMITRYTDFFEDAEQCLMVASAIMRGIDWKGNPAS